MEHASDQIRFDQYCRRPVRLSALKSSAIGITHPSSENMEQPLLGSQEFRRVLGHYPTGVCAITAKSPDGPIGMIVGSFTSVSLDPPLVAFMPDRKSATWPKIEATGRFCVNVLSDQQRHVCRSLSSKAANKFEFVPCQTSPAGLPIPDGTIAWIDCRLFAVHEAGDHYIVVGRVETLDAQYTHPPLLFFLGGYGSFSSAVADREVDAANGHKAG